MERDGMLQAIATRSTLPNREENRSSGAVRRRDKVSRSRRRGWVRAWPTSLLTRSRNCSTVDVAHAEVFDFEEFLDAVFRAFAADAAFLHAAEGGDLGRDDAFVDADDAVFERLGDPPDAANIAAVEIGGEAELGVVGHLDRLGLGLEAVERRHWAKGLFLGDEYVGRHIGQYRRLEERDRECRALTVGHHV